MEAFNVVAYLYNYIQSESFGIGKLAPLDTVKLAIYRFHLTQPNSYISRQGEVVPITSNQKKCAESHAKQLPEVYKFRHYPVGLAYKPYTIYVRRYPHHDCYELVVELSLPKLRFGNNVYELTLDMFDTVVLKLHHLLKDCGAIVTQADIADESVMMRIDVGKNFLLQNCTVAQFVKPLKMLNKGYSYIPEDRNYQRGGLYVRWDGNQYTIFYDKVLELKDTDPKNYKLFKYWERRILRLEHRLKDKQTIEREYGLERSISLREAFNSETTQKILIKNLDQLTRSGKYLAMLIDIEHMGKLYQQMLKTCKKSPYRHLKHDWLILVQLFQAVGEIEAKELITENYSKQTYKKYLDGWHSFSQHVSINDPRYKDFEAVLEALDAFEPLQIGRM